MGLNMFPPPPPPPVPEPLGAPPAYSRWEEHRRFRGGVFGAEVEAYLVAVGPPDDEGISASCLPADLGMTEDQVRTWIAWRITLMAWGKAVRVWWGALGLPDRVAVWGEAVPQPTQPVPVIPGPIWSPEGCWDEASYVLGGSIPVEVERWALLVPGRGKLHTEPEE